MANNAPFPGMQPPRPPISLGPAQGGPPSMSIQFRPAVPLPVAQQSQPYASVPSHQFQQVAHTNIGLPSHNQQFQFSQPVPQLPARPSMVGPGFLPPQSVPTPEVQSNRSSISVSPQPLQNAQVPNSYAAGLGGPQMPLSAPYTFGPPSGGQLQRNDNSSTHYQPLSQMNISSFPVGGQPWLLAGSQAVTSVVPVQQIGEQSSATTAVVRATTLESIPAKKRASFWLEHTSCAGKKYYYNRKTKFSTWEKPIELMTSIERADASTNWKEYESPDGRKYYYNRVTKQSKWIIPDELKLAREQVKNMASSRGPQAGKDNSPAPVPVALSVIKEKHFSGVTSSLLADAAVSSPIEVATVSDVAQGVAASEHSALPVVPSVVTTNTIDVETYVETVTEVTIVSDSAETSHTLVTTVLEQMSDMNSKTPQDIVDAVDGISPGVTEETEKGKGSAGQVTVPAVVDKTVVQEVLVYENKLEAKKAFKALLESANVGSDWTWDQAMRAIINDPRYGALRTLGERKQAFNEFLVQRKKQDAEERRARLRKAQEDFRTMLEESKELTSSTRWSKAIAMFEDDERFKAVERAKDREDLFEDYMEELEKKERAKALEEKKRNRIEYLNLLKSCDFITASSQWRKVQDRLEDDERCSRLEKIDRLEIFQEYIRDLEKEEEEQRKLQLDELRKAERKNRDEFRKLMEGHVAEGILTAETHWREYCMKVKDLPAYLAVSSNTSGSTAKDLFEDVAEELQKQYLEDKDWIKDTMKLKKIALSSNWTFEDFKAAVTEDIRSPPLSDTNLKLIFSELQERAKEKEEKEAKRRKRLADDFNVILCTSKDITASCRWEDWKQIHEYKQESWFIEEESFFREIFENYVTDVKEKVKEKERMRRADKAKREKEVNDREKEKHLQEKGRGSERKNVKDRMRSEKSDDETESYFLEENKRSGKDKEKKHRKRHGSSLDYSSSDETEKDRSRRSHRHSSERKKSKQMERRSTSKPDSSQNKHKRHKKDRRSGSHRKSDYEDRDFGEDDVDVW